MKMDSQKKNQLSIAAKDKQAFQLQLIILTIIILISIIDIMLH